MLYEVITRGALPITYHIGPGSAKVHLKLEFNWDMKPIYNVIATLKGTKYPDEWVIRGNHHDACRITSYNVCYTKLLRIPFTAR